MRTHVCECMCVQCLHMRLHAFFFLEQLIWASSSLHYILFYFWSFDFHFWSFDAGVHYAMSRPYISGVFPHSFLLLHCAFIFGRLMLECIRPQITDQTSDLRQIPSDLRSRTSTRAWTSSSPRAPTRSSWWTSCRPACLSGEESGRHPEKQQLRGQAAGEPRHARIHALILKFTLKFTLDFRFCSDKQLASHDTHAFMLSHSSSHARLHARLHAQVPLGQAAGEPRHPHHGVQLQVHVLH